MCGGVILFVCFEFCLLGVCVGVCMEGRGCVCVCLLKQSL